jgi:hypothetical protein
MHCGEGVESAVATPGGRADVTDADEYAPAARGRDAPSATGAGESPADRWIDPDGWIDDVSTLAVAAVAAVVVAVLSFVVVLLVAQSLLSVLLGPLAGLGAGVWVARNRSVFGALQKACYATATALALVPSIALGPSMKGGTFGGQVLLFLIAAMVLWIPALVLAGVGYAAGKRQPTSVHN